MQDISNTFWAFATLRYNPGKELLDAASPLVFAMADRFKPQEIANLLWSYAALGHTPDAHVLDSMAAQVVAGIRLFRPQVLPPSPPFPPLCYIPYPSSSHFTNLWEDTEATKLLLSGRYIILCKDKERNALLRIVQGNSRQYVLCDEKTTLRSRVLPSFSLNKYMQPYEMNNLATVPHQIESRESCDIILRQALFPRPWIMEGSLPCRCAC